MDRHHRPIRRVMRLAVWPWLGLLLCTAVCGCKVGPDYCPTQTVVPDAWHQELSNGQTVGPAELGAWWQQFDDPLLTTLIECAADYNRDLAGAYWRVSQARSERCVVNSDRWPSLGGSGAFQHSLQSLNGLGVGGIPGFLLGARDLWNLQLDVAWEPDVFGRVKRAVEAAEANTCAQIEAYRDILVVLYGDVAQTYVQIRTLQAQLEFAHQDVEIQERALDLARRRVEGGVSPNVDVFQAEASLAALESAIPPFEIQLHQALNRLSVLVGHYPGTLHEFLAAVEPIPQPPEYLPIVVPCEVVRQRPDIRQAERVIAARTAEIGVAVADLYPRFTLGGNIGISSQNFSTLFDEDSFAYGFGPSFTWPIFQAGRIRCFICQREAILEEAIATYEQTLLRAFEEIENAIVSHNKERVRRDALRRTVTASEKSLESVLLLYREGKVDFQRVLDTLRTLFLARNDLATSEGQIVTQLIVLYRALGGGWDPDSHCEKRCDRLHCPTRFDPSVVDNIPVRESADRYFDLGSSEDDSDSADTDEKELPDDAAEESERSKEFFDKTLQELEERLKTAPQDGEDLLEMEPQDDDAVEPPAKLRELPRPEAEPELQKPPSTQPQPVVQPAVAIQAAFLSPQE